ncbi:MAG: dephospho-CoA kinase [Saprospiraceae bacterium]|nr:dephospho-CoA kinase [Saprospiraceae bacterium]
MTLRVGITGGIGSGKTTVCAMFEILGVPVYYADDRARALIVENENLRAGITELLGEEAYHPDGSYNRTFVASVVFAQPEKLAALNALVHPAVETDSLSWHEAMKAAGHAYTIKEAALMIESGAYHFLDYLVVVTAPEEVRVQRVIQRDGLSENEVYARIKRQMPEAEKLVLADFTIVNDGTKALTPQVWALHRRFTALSGTS